MATNVTLHAGHDITYLTAGQGAGGCAGAMSYYTAAGEPPGQWAGKGATALGLSGQVDPQTIGRLYQDNIGPGGELLVKRRQSKAAADRENAAVTAYLAAHPYASATELAEVRAAERGKDPHHVPYFDLTVSAVKSVSVLHASYRVAAKQARDRGDDAQAAAFDARAGELEDALLDSAREAVAWLDRHAAYTRTGHHSAQSGEWRDGGGLVASLFLHHLSRDGDPQLHVHVAIWNRIQRGDGADDKWRTLDSRTLHGQRLGVAPVADRILETWLTALGYVMVPRADGNGTEIGGVPQDVMDLFSSRAVAVTNETGQLARDYQAVHGRAPSRRTLWLLHQQAGQRTRRTKAEARRTLAGQTGATEPTAAQRLAAWQAQTMHRELQALSAVHGQVTRFAAACAGRASAPLDDAAKRAAARIAVAEVQKQHAVWSMAQLRFEVHRALPVLPAGTDVQAVVDEVAELAVGGRAGTGVVQVTAPDIADVTGLGVRASDGGSIYRPPNAGRYCTVAHLDAEAQILAAAKRTVPQLVTNEAACEAVGQTDLTAEQRDAVQMMLTAGTAATVLIAPAGAGKSHTMAAFARLWTTFTGRRVIGLTTSTNAARVLAHEGLAESYNIAAFLGKTEGSDELRRPVPLHRDDVLVLDEASQLATGDLAMISEAARQSGARVIVTGDTAQLGAVEAGGMLALLASEVLKAELHEVRRFAAGWEREASVRLRDGDRAAAAAYDRHGRIRGADHEAAYHRAASMWVADHLRGKDVLLLAGSNSEAAELSRQVQAKLVKLGAVGPPMVLLADGNHAGTGDLVRARLNTGIDACGRKLTNRDTLKITGWRGPDAEVRRQRLDGTWTGMFRLPRSYLARSAELAYGGNVHVAQGRTVDTAHLLVTATLPRQALYVGMTRGRESNTAHVVTGTSTPLGKKPYQQATAESVLAGVLQREGDDLSATGQICQAQEWAGGTGHLITLWSAAVRQTLYPAIDEQITARLTDSEAWRYQREPSRLVLQHALRDAQLAGYDIGAIIDRITASPMEGAWSVASVLHGRLRRLPLPTQDHGVTWAQRTPESAPALAHELAAGLDDRRRELGRRALADPEPWLTRHLGPPPGPDVSPVLREDYARRAGTAAAYREAAAITDPQQAVSFCPHPGPELETLRTDTLRALEIADEHAEFRAMGRGELEAQLLQADRAQAAAPPDTGHLLRATAQAEADAWQQAADSAAHHDQVSADNARSLAAALAAEVSRLEAADARFEEWSARTAITRERAGKARAELQRLGQQPSGEGVLEPQDMAAWWRDFQVHAEAVDRAIDRDQQAAIREGRPWPPELKPEAGHEEPVAAAPETGPRPGQVQSAIPEASTEPERPAFEPRTPQPEVAGPGPADNGRAARLDELQSRADEAVRRINAQQAEHDASSQHTARTEREAQGEPEADRQADRSYEMDR